MLLFRFALNITEKLNVLRVKGKRLDIYDIALRVILISLGAMLLFGLHLLRRAYVADQFIIPTQSMAPTLIAGDRVIVNKLIIGARIYDNFDFAEGRPLQSHRVRGLRKVKHNDIVVFNFPLNWEKQRIEFKINYVYAKRCIGLPGDSVSIKNSYYYSNNCTQPLGDIEQQRNLLATADSLIPGSVLHCSNGWTIKEFGPLYVPKQGECMSLNLQNYELYKQVIEFETGEKLARNAENVLMLGSVLISEYRFENNYYFVCGDNVMDSQDSRYWGFVPEEFIVGVVSRITYSQDQNTAKFRWNRLMKNVLKD